MKLNALSGDLQRHASRGNLPLFLQIAAAVALSFLVSWAPRALAVVGNPPRIIQQPMSQTVFVGEDAHFTVVVAQSSTPLSFQWYHGAALIQGADGPEYWINGVEQTDGGNYRVMVMNAAGSMLSSNAVLTVLNPPQCVFMPPGMAGGQSFDNSGASPEPRLTNDCGVLTEGARWMCFEPGADGVCVLDTLGSDIDTLLAIYTTDATGLPLFVACDDNGADGLRSRVAFSVHTGMQYLAYVDGVGGMQGMMNLNWRFGIPPLITNQPSSQTVQAGTRLVLDSGASGNPPPSFQWRREGTNIAGATGGTWIVDNALPRHSGRYTVEARNFVGSDVSREAVIIVEATVRLEAAYLTNGVFGCRITGPPGATYITERSPDLKVWTGVATNESATGFLEFKDSSSPPGVGFYRVNTF